LKTSDNKILAVDANVKTVMNSFNILNGIPATGNAFLQRDILKDKWNFKGFVISDWGSAGEMVNHGYAKDLKEAAQLAANAGSDMDMESYAYVTYLKALVETGKVNIKVVDEAVSRILRVKYELGLFDDPYRYCDVQREKEIVFSKESKDKALDVAKKSIVLLKNENALLPLNQEQKNIAVIGALANDQTSPLGSWRIGSDDNTAISVVEGIKGYTNDFKYEKGVTLVKGAANFIQELNINETDTTGFAAAIALAKSSSVVIMVLGEHGFQSGEGRSRTKLDLPGLQQQLLEAVYAVNKNIILVLMNGRPLAIPWAAKNIPSIVEAWQLGTMSGQAIADVLFGAYNPGGKLPMSFPRSVGQVPIYYNQFNTGRGEVKPEVFWSHYSDESNLPLYPFGYGLSYTSFAYSNLKINKNKTGNFEVSITVTNKGKKAGDEIVQLYIHDLYASNVRPFKELKGFSKVHIESGKSSEVKFVLTDAELGFFTSDGKFVVESGMFDVMVGGSSEQGLKGSFVK
jgi:beta-glucosidase